MKDIISIDTDIGFYDTQTSRAANILSIQVGDLEYQPDFGIDLNYFLSEDFSFQNESFKAYLVQILSNNGINVSSVAEVIDDLFSTFDFNLVNDAQSGSLVAR